MAQQYGFVGLDKFAKAIGDIPREIWKNPNIVGNAASKSLIPVAKGLKSRLRLEAGRHDSGLSGYDKLLYLSFAVKRYVVKSRHVIGARVRVRDDLKMRVGKKRVRAQSMVKLFAGGNPKTPGRKGRGDVAGYGDFALDVFKTHRMGMSITFRKKLGVELRKAADRALRKRGIR